MSNVIRVSAHDADDELRSFLAWLQEDSDIRRHAVISLESADGGKSPAGEMGGALEIVKLVIDTNFQVLNLGLAYTAWRASRGRPTPVTVERNGVTIVLDDAEPETVARLVRELDR